MSVEISHLCLITNFIDVEFSTKKIYESTKEKIVDLMLTEKIEIPQDWKLIFDLGYNNGRLPLVAKNKLGSYPSDKMKYIKIVIPIPLISEINWGVKPEQHLYKKDHYDKLMKNFWELDIDFRSFTNRTDYITACLKAGIKKAFEEGFTVGGVKIKAKKPVEI